MNTEGQPVHCYQSEGSQEAAESTAQGTNTQSRLNEPRETHEGSMQRGCNSAVRKDEDEVIKIKKVAALC